MEFLDKETEALLKECVDNEPNFINLLHRKFEEAEDCSFDIQRLHSKIKLLIDKGFFSPTRWASNKPFFGLIEQKGRTYFKDKEIYIRAMLKKDPYFKLLDDESEEALRKIAKECKDGHITVNYSICGPQVAQYLVDVGYLKASPDDFSYFVTGDYSLWAQLSQKGKNYFRDKEQRIEEILLCGQNAINVTNIGKQEFTSGNKFVGFENCTDVVNCKAIYSENGITDSHIINSPVQMANSQSTQNTEYNFQQAQEALDEIKSKIDELNLTPEKKEELEENIEAAEEYIKTKKKAALKGILRVMGGIIKDFGVSVGSGILIAKMQGLM